jgi:hypothetical protein
MNGGDTAQPDIAERDGSYPVRRPHIEADPARSEDANVPEPAASKPGRRRRAASSALAFADPAGRAGGGRHTEHERRPRLRRRIRYGLGLALAGADIAAAWPSGGGTSKAEIGVASSSARSRPRVARQYLGESSR